MVTRIAALATALITLGILLISPASGCGSPVNNSENTTPLPTTPIVPRLDAETHRNVATAYFALG
jgi:hypothetical protein